MPLKKLNLDQLKVDKYLNSSKENGVLLSDDIKGHGRHCKFKLEDKECLLILFLTKTGTATIQYEVGQNQDLSKTIAEEIVEACKISDNNSASCTFRNISDDDFQLIKEFITEDILDASFETIEDTGKQLRIIAEGRYHDKASIVYYKTTGTALLQGKPLPIFQEIKLFFYELISNDDIIENENKVFNINITKTDISNQLQGYLPTAINFLDNKIVKILTPSLALDCVNIELDDYSCFSFPALRGIEGYVKQLLKQNFKEYKNTNKLGSLFKDPDEQHFFPLQDFVKDDIKCSKTIEAIETSYNLYHSRRHPLFHVDKHVSSTPIIENKESAQAINVEILTTIETTYRNIPQ